MRWKDGSLLPVEIGLNPILNGARPGALATIVDISERKNLERRTQILADEISHRARNLLTVVQALALRKLPRKDSGDFVKTLEALARTQKIFGTFTVAPLRSIIEGELVGVEPQVAIAGCNVLLTPAAGQDFSLIVHELATNAFKYGALSEAEGRIDIRGRERKDGTFHMVWTERGGPIIKSPPERRGFGQQVLKAIVKGLSGTMKLDYRPEGLRYELVVPTERITNVSKLGKSQRA
jgi:two-component sensor histidine kinase